MKRLNKHHLYIDEVYKDYNEEPGTEMVFLNPLLRFKRVPSFVELLSEHPQYFVVRVYFGEPGEKNKERSYTTSIDKFDVFNEDVYFCRNYTEEDIYV